MPVTVLLGRNVQLPDILAALGLQSLDSGGKETLLQRGQRPALLQRLRHHAEKLQLQPPFPRQRAVLALRPSGIPLPIRRPALPRGARPGHPWTGGRHLDPRRESRGRGSARHAAVPVLLPRAVFLRGVQCTLGQQHTCLDAGAGQTPQRPCPQPLAAVRAQRQEGRRQAAAPGRGTGAAAVPGPRQDGAGKSPALWRCRRGSWVLSARQRRRSSSCPWTSPRWRRPEPGHVEVPQGLLGAFRPAVAQEQRPPPDLAKMAQPHHVEVPQGLLGVFPGLSRFRLVPGKRGFPCQKRSAGNSLVSLNPSQRKIKSFSFCLKSKTLSSCEHGAGGTSIRQMVRGRASGNKQASPSPGAPSSRHRAESSQEPSLQPL